MKKKGQVIYDFEGFDSSELSCKAGAIVEVVEVCDDGWTYCKIEAEGETKKGYIPTDFVIPFEEKHEEKKKKEEIRKPYSKPVEYDFDTLKKQMKEETKISHTGVFNVKKQKEPLSKIANNLKSYINYLKLRNFLKSRKIFEKQKKRLAQIKETIETEDNYVDGINFCIEKLKKPLLQKKIITNEQNKILFSNMQPIRDCAIMLSTELHKELKKVPEIKISQCFKKISPFFKLYKTYVNNFKHANELYEKIKKKSNKFNKFVDVVYLDPKANKLKLEDFFLLPVMRIPRYKLLFEGIIKLTPKDHVEYSDLLGALDIISDVASFVNESKREKKLTGITIELSDKLKGRYNSLIQSFRKFNKKVKLKIQCKEKNLNKFTWFHCYLFTDLIIFLEHESVFQLKQPRAALVFLAFSEIYEEKNTSLIKTISDGKVVTYQVLFASKNDKKEWTKLIKKNIKDVRKGINNKGLIKSNIFDLGHERVKEYGVAKSALNEYNTNAKQWKEKDEEYSKVIKECKFLEDKLKEVGAQIDWLQKKVKEITENTEKEKKDVKVEIEKVDAINERLKRDDTILMGCLGKEIGAFKEIFGELPSINKTKRSI